MYSMGGLVVCVCVELLGMVECILGVVYGVMLVFGVLVIYKCIWVGFEGVGQVVLGCNVVECMVVMVNVFGLLELLLIV